MRSGPVKTDADLEVLDSCAESLASTLVRFHEQLERVGRHHKLHDDFALRARHLGLHLEGVRRLVNCCAYPSALSLLRTCLEHHLIDHLVLLGRRYVTVHRNVTEEDFDAMLAEYESGVPHAVDICARPTRSNKGHVRIVREGHRVTTPDGDQGYTISPIYFVLQRHQPFVGRPSDQSLLDDGILDLEAQVEQAHRQRKLWHQNLSWSSITASLVTNEFYSEKEMLQWEVHYRFLSAFTHATTTGYEQVHSRLEMHSDPRAFDHYSHELAMLYVNALGSRELDVLIAMAANPPKVGLRDRDRLVALGRRARDLASVLWLPRDDPHAFDRRDVADRQTWIAYRQTRDLNEARGIAAQHGEPPDDVPLYYSNPLERLIQMHQSSTEMTTGRTYQSPWDRPDAFRR